MSTEKSHWEEKLRVNNNNNKKSLECRDSEISGICATDKILFQLNVRECVMYEPTTRAKSERCDTNRKNTEINTFIQTSVWNVNSTNSTDVLYHVLFNRAFKPNVNVWIKKKVWRLQNGIIWRQYKKSSDYKSGYAYHVLGFIAGMATCDPRTQKNSTVF